MTVVLNPFIYQNATLLSIGAEPQFHVGEFHTGTFLKSTEAQNILENLILLNIPRVLYTIGYEIQTLQKFSKLFDG